MTRRGLAAAGLALLCASACRPAPGPPSTLTIAVRADVTAFFPNPPGLNDSYTSQMNQSLFEGLVAYDRQLALVPALAERWENPDDRTYRFTLRPGLRFSNGRRVTARDVAASLEAAIRHGWETRDYIRAIESARALDDRRVEVRTRVPTLSLLTRLPWGYVLPADAVDLHPVLAVGTGPYKLLSRTPGREFVFLRNPYYRGPAPAFERVRFVVVPDDHERVSRVERGAADVADLVPLELVAGLRKRDDVHVVSRSGLQALFLCLRVDKPPFSDTRVRTALDLALDRGELVRRALSGQGQVASQVVPPMIVGHDPSIVPTPVDRVEARRLLAEAGFPGGLEVRLDGTRNRYVNDREILAEVARQLGEVGMRVKVNALDKVAFYDLIDSGESKLHLLGWSCLSGDAGDILDSLLHSPTEDMLGLWNTLGLEDPELDRSIDASQRSTLSSDRTRHLQAAMRRVAELRAVAPLAFPAEAVVLSRGIDWEPSIDLALRPAGMRPAAR